jgi:protein-tyrosine phosphatase
MGSPLGEHRARKLTPQIMRESDLFWLRWNLLSRFISAMALEIRGKSLLFGQWLGHRTSPIPIVKAVKHSTVFRTAGQNQRGMGSSIGQQGMKR